MVDAIMAFRSFTVIQSEQSANLAESIRSDIVKAYGSYKNKQLEEINRALDTSKTLDKELRQHLDKLEKVSIFFRLH